ncbi:hypothetical protein [Streptomyces sp. NPDC006863]
MVGEGGRPGREHKAHAVGVVVQLADVDARSVNSVVRRISRTSQSPMKWG